MCGRYTQTKDSAILKDRFGLEPGGADLGGAELRPRFNLAPGQEAAVVLGGPPRLVMMRWGLVPHWAKDTSAGFKTINARAETLAEKPAFKGPLRRGRCLVAADGFYEWSSGGRGGGRQPWWFGLKGNDLFAFAGLWDACDTPDGQRIFTFTIITTQANELVKPVHERMPVILSPESETFWLDPEFEDPKQALTFLRPYSPELMQAHPVSALVNSVKNDSPACLRPTAQERGLFDDQT